MLYLDVSSNIDLFAGFFFKLILSVAAFIVEMVIPPDDCHRYIFSSNCFSRLISGAGLQFAGQCIRSTGRDKSATMFTLLFLLATSVAGLTPDIITVIQEQTASVAEASLGLVVNNSMGNCMLNKYCKVAAAPKARIPTDSIAAGLSMSFEVINKALENNKGRSLPNLMRIKTAFELGRKTQEDELCEQVFPCGVEINLPTEAEVQARIAVPDCDELGMVCPGVSQNGHFWFFLPHHFSCHIFKPHSHFLNCFDL